MRKTVMAIMLSMAMLATAGLANTATGTAGMPNRSPVIRPIPKPIPVVQAHAPALSIANTTLIHWDKFYDRHGNPLPAGAPEDVSPDSLYWKDLNSSIYLKSSAKVASPSPANRSAMSFPDGQSTVCMDPVGNYVYEADGDTLYRFSTVDGSMTTYTLADSGGSGCATDGQYIYCPNGTTMYKYTMNGNYVSSTTTDYTCDAYSISCCRDTVWFTNDRYNGVTLYGYACSKFTGGSITHDATWNVGTGTDGVGNVAWDGVYYYLPWIGTRPITFKRFYADRTLYSSGTVSIDSRGVMCSVQGARSTAQDSLYWKLNSSTTNLYSSPKAQEVTAAQASPFAWQNSQTISCMTPDGLYMFEVYANNMRRTNLATGEVINYALADSSGGACGTDGQYVYVPKGTMTRKYNLTGSLISTTTTDYAPVLLASTFGFGVANDTVWLTPVDTGKTWYGYACSKFTGGSITHDAMWSTVGGAVTAMTVTWDGQYYYMCWGGHPADTLLRFYRDRTLYSTGTVTGDARSVMCKAGSYPVMLCEATSYPDHVASFSLMLVDSSGGKFAAADTYHIGTSGHDAFPATDWYNHGYRAIMTFTDQTPTDPSGLGDSMARFIQLGGGVVEATFSDCTNWQITGNWRLMYAPFTVQSASFSSGTMGTVHQPLHPVMLGVSALSVGDYRSGNTDSTLRGQHSVCLSEYTDGNICLAACFDSAGQRALSIGMDPMDYWITPTTGQWCRLMVNALDWVAVGPSVGVTAPNGGETWDVGSVHNITWTQTANGVSDSIYYSTDGGASWTGVTWFAAPPSPLQYAWTVPNDTTKQAQVKLVTWNSDGGRVEDASDADFTIAPPMAVEQPRNSALPLVFALHQPQPNPATSGATVRYDLPRPAQVELSIYDVSGALVRRLVRGAQTAGYRSAYWNGTDSRGRAIAPGVYYCRFTAGDSHATQKLVVRR